VVLSVADTGTGMPPGVSEQAFEPFFTTKDVGEGSGLGLSMIYGFAKQSGGFVTIDSEEGSGTTVKLYLPRSHEAAPELVDEDSPEPRASEQKMILVIEDDPGVRELAVSMLESMGYRVHSVTDLTTAREALLSNGPPDLILSDVVLPGRASGPDIVAEIIESHPNVRTIFMSGYPAEIVGQETLLKVGASLINKPFSMNELEQAVREALV
jgi:CheY-like chemotaxis protein